MTGSMGAIVIIIPAAAANYCCCTSLMPFLGLLLPQQFDVVLIFFYHGEMINLLLPLLLLWRVEGGADNEDRQKAGCPIYW
jgi:hypothetical protein